MNEKLDAKKDGNLIWEPDWDQPNSQIVNDSVSYVFYPLVAYLTKDGKRSQGEIFGAKPYLIVKNENEFYRGLYYKPNNEKEVGQREINVDHFTGNLLLKNLEGKETFLLRYKNGMVINTPLTFNTTYQKQMSLDRNISYYETRCRTEINSCTYYTYLYSSTGGIVIEFSFSCSEPSYCRNSIWILSDYNVDTVCEEVWFPDPPTDPGGGGSNSGGENSGSNNIPAEPILPGQDHLAIDVKKFIKCFDNIPNAGATYKVIVQVLEPVPGTNLNYGPVNGVGHTAITLIKQGSNGIKVTQTVGFYPTTNPFNSPSKMVNNSDQTDYTIRMIFDMGSNSIDFNKILTGATSPPAQYNLLGMNCTAFVNSVCNLGGLTLPNPVTLVGIIPPPSLGTSPVFAMTPGGLGNSMRTAHSAGDNRISSGPTSTSNNPASNGPCN